MKRMSVRYKKPYIYRREGLGPDTDETAQKWDGKTSKSSFQKQEKDRDRMGSGTGPARHRYGEAGRGKPPERRVIRYRFVRSDGTKQK